jgi:ERCC4-related helicase
MPVFAPPEQGSLVQVRQRRFVVTEVQQNPLALDPLRRKMPQPQHLVTLASIEDDALGEEVQVIWELEPGARVMEKGDLPAPTSFDDPRRLDAFLDAVRWYAASSADVRALQSPFRSGIEIEEYQLDPVVRAIQMPRANLLIADDVGLGKTIEAGLVCQELLLRHRARKILVVCPASLQNQWRDHMRDKFGLEFRIVDAELMKTLRRERGLHVNPWTHFPRLITSIDFLKRERPLRLMREALPAEGEHIYPRRFDMLIVDEAHNIAPSGRGRYAVGSQRTEVIRLLAPHFEHKLFLSATPHNGYQESFTALLELLDSQRFARGVPPKREQLATVMVRRLKSELKGWDGGPRFAERKLEAIEVPYSEEERRAHALLRRYSESRLNGLQNDTASPETYATKFVLKLLKKRLFSSPQAFALTLERHRRSLETARRAMSAARQAPIGLLRQQLERAEEEYGAEEEQEEAVGDALEEAARLFRAPSSEEERLLDAMQRWAEQASTHPDSKTEQLIAWLKRELLDGGQWSERRAIIFTEYRDTQKWLESMLASAGLTQGQRVMTLYGGMDSQERERMKAAFQADPSLNPVRILLATDAASEGIDLQNYCSRLVHFEIPWNPNRMEQRNGRVDRHGQRAPEVLIYHFVGAGYQQRQQLGEEEALAALSPGELEADLEFLMKAAQKVNQIREDLGNVGPVIAEQVEEAMLGRRARLDTRGAEQKSGRVRAVLQFEQRLREQVDRLHKQLLESKSVLRLEPDNIEAVVKIALDLAGQPPLREETLIDPLGRYQPLQVSYLPRLTGSWAACAQGLEHPLTRVVRPIVFDESKARGRDDVVLAHLNHALVQRALRLLRAEVWSSAGGQKLHRVTARLVPNSALDTPALIAHARLVLLGSDYQRLHEELMTAGGFIREGRFARMNVGEVQRALEAALPQAVPDAVQQRLAETWSRFGHEQAILAALEARKLERVASLQRLLEDRAQKEISDTTAILEELRNGILAELRQDGDMIQLSLFSLDERQQYDEDRRFLERRLAEIPGEIERETAAIRKRFANPEPSLFPVAITYLVPERLAGG